MSIKFKQNGQWVKIPTPSQIDDSAASAATTYSSNKINEIIPQGIAKYLLEHKDELGTDDFTKLKNVPFTTINTTNKSEFTTLKGILDHPDGMYLVDDCGVTNGDAQLTIASFKGHCSTMLMASIAQFQEIVDSDEIRCYKGSVIYILTEGNISNGATRYVTICNVPMGVSGGSVAPDRGTSDAGTSVVNIEVHPVEDRSSGTVTYSYDIDSGTQTLFTQPQYVSMITHYTNALVSGGIIAGKSSYSPNQLVKVVEDADCQLGYRFTGVDISEFKSPFTLITNENATNYNTLDKLCHLSDGLYLCKDTYKTNQDYIVEVTFDGISLLDSTMYSFTGTEPTPDAYGSTKCKNGAIISVVTQTDNTKNKIVRITHGLNGDLGGHGNGFDDVYIIAEPDDSTASTLVYGVTGANVRYFKPFNINMVYGSLFPFAAMNRTLFDGANANGKMAVWNKSESAEMPTLGYADIPSNVVPTFEVNDASAANYDSLEKWFSVDDGVYYINTTNVYGNNGGYIDVPKLKKVSFVGTGFTSGSSGASTKTIEDGVISLLNGATVYVNTNSDADGHIEKFVQFNSVYVSGDISAYVLFRKMKSDTYSSTNVYFTDILTNLSLSGQMTEEISSIFGTDGLFPNIITEDDELTTYNTLQKWMNLSPGRYLVMRNDLTVEVSAMDVSKSTDNSFIRTLSIPKNTFVFVYSTDDSNSSATNFKNVVFQKADNMPSGYYGEWMTFKWDSRKTYSADNVELYPLMTAAMNGAVAVDMVMVVLNLFADLSASDVGKVVKIASGDTSDSYKFQAVDISLIGDTTTITPAQVLAAVNEGKTTTISHTDTTYGKLKFTSFGVVTTASGDTVSSSITYGTSADSLMLFTLMGDVTKGTWTMYSRNLTVSA